MTPHSRINTMENKYSGKSFSQFSHSVMFGSLGPHGLQHARLPCPSPTPGAYSNSYPLSWWYHPIISSCHPSPLLPPSVFPSIRVFSNESVLRIRWLKYWSFSFSISPSNEYSDLFPLGWTGCISLMSKEVSGVFQHHSSKASILWCSAFFTVQLSHAYMTTGKTTALIDRPLLRK